MNLRSAVVVDHGAIVAAIAEWWAGRDLTALLQPLFLENFASTSLVAEDDDGRMIGFLVGFPSVDDGSVAYVHFVGVAPEVRGAGLGRVLHDTFAATLSARGIDTVRCVTSPLNEDSVAFHRRIGFEVESVDDRYVHLVRRVAESRFSPVPDPRPKDPPWGEAIWPIPRDTVLSGRLVELRPSVREDAPGLMAALDHDRVWTHVRGRPVDVEGYAKAVDQAPAIGRLPWTVRQEGRIVGWSSFCEVSPVDARLEIGYTGYAPDVWGTGVNPECKLLLMDWAFEHGFGRVQLKTDVRNVRSQQAIARLGAQYEGVLRRYQRRHGGSVRDTVVFSVTVEDWPVVRDGLLARTQ